MKFSISREKLMPALETCAKVAMKTKAMPVLSNISVSVKNGKAYFEATSTEVTVRSCAGLESSDGEVRILVDAASLLKYIKLTRCETIGFESNDRELRISHDKGRLNIALSDMKGWPESALDAEKESTEILIPSSVIASLVGECPTFVGHDDFHPQMMSAHIKCTPASISYDATDSRKLLHVEQECDCPVSCDILIPQDVMPMLVPQSSMTAVSVSDNDITWNLGSTVICHVKVKGNYPDVTRVIPKDNPVCARCDRRELMSAMRRISALMSDTTVVKLDFTGSVCQITSVDIDTQKSLKEAVMCECTEPFRCGVSAPYFLDCLSAVADDTVSMHMSQPNRPIVIRSKAEPGKTILVMPMIINE